ncbi:DUF6603 domain-containing protein [Acidisphaera sp. S103]|uniref:DUF6603 domain-containing protein n=1 Tax=Acidisphaera sp. S103 TaxID=1747223 RepID=UPI00131DC51B|nr:DUF6603 domain-containing protein [Acidisphaera sp. S103]
MSSDSFLKQLLAGFASALEPLKEAVASPQAFASFLGGFGWTLGSNDLTSVTGSLGGLSTLAADPSSMSLAQLAADLVSAGNVIRRIATSGAAAAFASSFPEELLDFLVYYALAQQSAPTFALLHFGGVLNERRVPADSITGRAEYVQRLVNWGLLGQFTDQPLASFEKNYGWGTDFAADAFLRSLGILIRGFGGNAGLYPADSTLVDQYYSHDSSSAAGTTNLLLSPPSLQASVTSGSAAANTKLALLFLPIPPTATADAAPDGLAIMPVITGQASDTIAITDTITLTLAGDFLTRPVRAEIHPSQAALKASTGDSSVDTTVRLDAKSAAASPWIAIGAADSSRLEISAAHAAFGFSGQLNGDIDIQAEVGLDTAALVIDLSEGDGFVKGAVGSQPSRSPLSLIFKYSFKSGFSVSGNPRLQVTLPVMQSIGDAIQLQSISISLGAGAGNSFELDATVALSVSIGPIAAAVSGLGATLRLSVPENGAPPGNLGNADLSFGFLPPSGVGLSIDAAGVSGGGFLAHANDQYSGVLQLKFNDLALQAFGLITTQVAGADGYSLIALIDADFPPVQLGWGFTLDGVGGLLAVNRTASLDALRAAVKSGKVSSILFPTAAIGNATQVLSALDALFPTAPGRFLFGPMALIGWGTPTVLTASVAVVVELPEPIEIILLAKIEAKLPTPSSALVHLNMDALGVLDLTQDELSLDASLFDSKLISFVITGDMALRSDWASQREFLLAIGGFHPQFTPPAGFPSLNRVTISMPSGVVSKLRLAAYLAITSNSLQFGATLDVFIGVSGCGISGHLGFDALLQLDPFQFSADISGAVAVTVGGDDLASVSLDATLTGPAPWHIAGSFKIHVIFWDIGVSFSASWGLDAPSQPVLTIDVGALLNAALADPRNWNSQLPPGLAALTSTRQVSDPNAIFAHPLAMLEVHEQVVPLDLAITRFGQAVPSGASEFSITGFTVGGEATTYSAVQDDFAPAQFFDLSDTDKLAGPSFERHDAGAVITGNFLASAAARAKSIDYETLYIDTPGEVPVDKDTVQPSQPFPWSGLHFVMGGGAAARKAISRSGSLRYAAPGNPIKVLEPAFALAGMADLATSAAPAATGPTYRDAAAALLSLAPAQRAGLQIVGTHELVEAA